jgi:HEPN domain-containing protein
MLSYDVAEGGEAKMHSTALINTFDDNLLELMSGASRYLDWLKEAEDDFGTAEYLLQGRRYSKACFHAQQAAEKAVKAFLIHRCGKYEELHSVAALIESARSSAQVPADLVTVGNRLDRHYIPPRHPNAWPSGAPHERYSETDAREAVNDAAKILEFVEKNVR